MSKFKSVGEAKLKRDSLIMKLASNRAMLQKIQKSKDIPTKAGSLAAAEAAHEKTCDEFTEAHAFAMANRAKVRA